MLEHLVDWVDAVVNKNIKNANRCSVLAPYLRGYYPREFLDRCYFVVTKTLPKPQIDIDDPNIQRFLSQDDDGITYKNVYFIKPEALDDLCLHVHELVHVAQWSILGVNGFIERYLGELNQYGYNQSPLELMASEIEYKFRERQEIINVPNIVRQRI